MCGIIYSESFTGAPVNNDILQQFDLQRHRGTEGFGIYDGQELNMVHATKEDKILKWLVKYDSSLLLMHHRFPTSTKNVKKAAHPFSTKSFFGDNEYILVHNGVIYNADDLFAAHQERGIEYQSWLDDLTFNDSESLLWDFALTMEGQQESPAAVGRIAFICLKKTKGALTDMYFARNHGSPLHLNLTKDGMAISSEGEGAEVPVNQLHRWSYKDKQISMEGMFFEQYVQSYDHNYHFGGSLQRIADSWDDDGRGSYPGSDYLTDEEEEDDELNRVTSLRQVIKSRWNRIINPSRNYDMEAEFDEETDSYTASEVDREFDEDITLAAVECEAMNYLSSYRGHFEQAYWALECDYEDVCNAPATKANMFQMRLLERTMEYIAYDPEYTTEEAVSSLWETAWLQQTAE